MQLDLIQHQQEQLLKKDRQLQNLKQDREELLTKVEKFETRVNVLSKKLIEVTTTNHLEKDPKNFMSSDETHLNSDSDCQEIQQSSVKIEPQLNLKSISSGKSPDHLQLSFDQVIFVSSDIGPDDEKVIRDENFLCQTDILNSGSSTIDKVISSLKTVTDKSKASTSNVKSEVVASGGDSSSKESKGEKRTTSKSKNSKRQKTSQITIPDTSVPSASVSRPLTPNLSLLETEEPYDLYNCRREIRSYLDVTSLSNDDKHEKANIEVPSWRINPVPHSDSLLGTEVIVALNYDK